MLNHLFPSLRQLSVSADASLHVMMALSVPTEVDGVGVHVDVHEVVDDFTLDVVLHPVDQETSADIDDLNEGQVPVGQRQTHTSLRGRDILYFLRNLNILIVCF